MTANAVRISQVVPWIGDDERTLVDGVLEDNWLTEGTRSREFARWLMELAGGKPVFIDIDERTLQIDVTHADRFVTARTADIMPVHLTRTRARA